jgi:FAD synthase
LHCDFVQRLRPDANFESVEALIAQLERDEIATREVLARHTLQDDDPRQAAAS